jgi:hypothetical protein
MTDVGPGGDPLADQIYNDIQGHYPQHSGGGNVSALLEGGGAGKSGGSFLGISMDDIKTSMRKPIVVAIIVFIVINPYTLSFAKDIFPSLFSDDRMSIMQMRTLFLSTVVALILFFSSVLAS